MTQKVTILQNQITVTKKSVPLEPIQILSDIFLWEILDPLTPQSDTWLYFFIPPPPWFDATFFWFYKNKCYVTIWLTPSPSPCVIRPWSVTYYLNGGTLQSIIEL